MLLFCHVATSYQGCHVGKLLKIVDGSKDHEVVLVLNCLIVFDRFFDVTTNREEREVFCDAVLQVYYLLPIDIVIEHATYVGYQRKLDEAWHDVDVILEWSNFL